MTHFRESVDWKYAHIVIIDGSCRPEIADYVTKIMMHGCYISYQWYPALLSSKTGVPSPAMHIYPDELAHALCDKDRKLDTAFGLKAVLLTLENIVKEIEVCRCDSLELFNHGCRCGNYKSHRSGDRHLRHRRLKKTRQMIW